MSNSERATPERLSIDLVTFSKNPGDDVSSYVVVYQVIRERQPRVGFGMNDLKTFEELLVIIFLVLCCPADAKWASVNLVYNPWVTTEYSPFCGIAIKLDSRILCV